MHAHRNERPVDSASTDRANLGRRRFIRSGDAERAGSLYGRVVRVISLVDEHGSVVCEACGVIDPPLARFRALPYARWLHGDRGLLVRNTGCVSTRFMRDGVDVVFLDADLCVTRILRGVGPGRTVRDDASVSALELTADAAGRVGLACGARLGWGDAASS